MLIALAILFALFADNPPARRPEIVPPVAVVRVPVPRETALNGTSGETVDANDPRVAAAIKSDFESLAGPGSVEVDRADGNLFNIRIAVPTLSSEFCNPIYDHELKLFRLFPDLNFDFYLRLRNSD
ncbi:MAG TPA: hypothetical protein VG273_00170 [Bryobacteraceae bacterium]|jgi:hypothetical protein|nr:hypothetical protein [Bryobacteraceae bacterium]